MAAISPASTSSMSSAKRGLSSSMRVAGVQIQDDLLEHLQPGRIDPPAAAVSAMPGAAG